MNKTPVHAKLQKLLVLVKQQPVNICRILNQADLTIPAPIT